MKLIRVWVKLIILFLTITVLILYLYLHQYKKQIQTLNREVNQLVLQKGNLVKKIGDDKKQLFFLKDQLSNATITIEKKPNNEKWLKYLSINGNSSFSINYPLNWKISSTVFDDEKGNKVAEFSPGLIMLEPDDPDNKDCISKLSSGNDTYGSSLIKETQMEIGPYKTIYRINKTTYEGGSPNWTGTWYPNSYCLMIDKGVLFRMTFYEYTETPKNSKLYEQILSTLKTTKN